MFVVPEPRVLPIKQDISARGRDYKQFSRRSIVRLRNKIGITFLLAASLVAAQSCKYLFKSEYTTLAVTDLSMLVDTLPDQQKRYLAQNEPARKGLLDQLKRAFALAQAAEDAGLHKSDKFTREMALNTDRLLAVEYGKRNPDATVTKEEADAYHAAHKNDFENDLKAVNTNAKQELSDELKEQQRAMWSELKVRAERGRKAGLEKDPAVLAQVKFGKANVLANLYAQSLEEKFKLTDAEKKQYLAEHPEADIAKLKEKAQGLLNRVLQGESFEKIADEFNDDGTKGRGGDLDWFVGGKMDPDFEKAAFALQKGEISKELVKTSFGFHIIRVDDRRMSTPPPVAPNPAAPSASPAPAPTPQEEIRARHIYIGTQEADTFERKMVEDKVRRAMEDATLKFPVSAPPDFKVNVAGFDPNRMPGLGGGQGGQMKGIQPGENK
jgi:parvulin-like peptidyl-prolyl isomerase